MFYMANIFPPCRCAICGDYPLAALERFRHNKSEVLAQRRQDQHVAPFPNLLLLLAECIAFDAQKDFRLWTPNFQLPDSFFKILDPLQWMTPSKVQHMQFPIDLFYTFYMFYTAQIKEPPYIRHLDLRAILSKIRLDPFLLRLACRNDLLAPPKEPPLYRPDKPLLPLPLPFEIHGAQAAVRHADKTFPRLQRRAAHTPFHRQPHPMYPDFFCVLDSSTQRTWRVKVNDFGIPLLIRNKPRNSHHSVGRIINTWNYMNNSQLQLPTNLSH